MSLLNIENLSLSIGATPILHGVNLTVGAGEIVGIVGESGSGKSMTALATMQLLPEGSSTTGSIRFQDHQVLSADDALMQDLRGDDMAMIFQEPMTALNPVQTIGDQVAEGMILHEGISRSEAQHRAENLLERVGLPADRYPLSRFPHELSGGQRQRVMIAMACAQSPDLLIADEPTTALDVTLQAQILKLLRDLVAERGMGLILISHDLAVVAQMTDQLVVMRHGAVVEAGPTGQTLKALAHPYTAQLAAASSHVPARANPPVLTAQQTRPALVEVQNVSRHYGQRRASLFQASPPVKAVDDVSFKLFPGQSMGLVGESGCGKSTLARMVLALDAPTSGDIVLDGDSLVNSETSRMQGLRRKMQIVFQDPFASFNPRHTMERAVAEPLHLEPKLSRSDRRDRVVASLEEVGLTTAALSKYPHEFSGGQRQRLAIARALITRPRLIVADEPVSALDVSIRAQVMDLFTQLRERLGLTYLFISHDLGVVRAMCDEVLVMDGGKIVERGPVGDIFDHPQSEAARRLVEATPDLERALALRNDAA
ncbi:MAG: dipeptide ABC transporter ATP-binding protein [Pseudomonadota bacterium]